MPVDRLDCADFLARLKRYAELESELPVCKFKF